MKTKKMNLASIQGKLSRAEMKQIMAGSEGDGGQCGSGCSGSCTIECGGVTYSDGSCHANSSGKCYCTKAC